MDQISRKDLSVDVPHLTDSNENGLIAQALARFKEAVVENKAMTDAAVAAAKEQQVQSDHYAHEHERFMDAFTGAADRIARGDFSHRITEKVISEYEAIISQMNLMMGQLEGAQTEKVAAEKQIHLVVDALGSSLSSLAEGNLEISLGHRSRARICQAQVGLQLRRHAFEEHDRARQERRRQHQTRDRGNFAGFRRSVAPHGKPGSKPRGDGSRRQGNHRYRQQDGTRRDARPRNGVGRQGRCGKGRRGCPQSHRSHERHRKFIEADQPDHRRHRRDRVPDQSSGIECRR